MAELDIYLYSEVSDGEAQNLRNILDANPDASSINIRISSPGGYVYEGWTYGNILKSLPIKTTALIEGFCGSIATYIALSCDEVKIADTAQFMIHNSSASIAGNKSEMGKAIEMLSRIDKDLVKMYVKKTGLEESKVIQMMNDETFMNAEETISLGFADGKMETLKAVAKFDISEIMKDEQIQEVQSLSKQILSGINKLIGKEQPKFEEPKNMTMTLADGRTIFVESEDGEFEGKSVFLVGADGNVPLENGTYQLEDGRSMTVEEGTVVSVQETSEPEGESDDKEKEEKMAAMQTEIDNLKAQLAEKETAKANAEAENKNILTQVEALAKQVENLSSLTVGEEFKADKPHVAPKSKDVDPAPTANGFDFASWGRKAATRQ